MRKTQIPYFQIRQQINKYEPQILKFDVVVIRNSFNPQTKVIERKDEVLIPKGSRLPVSISKFVYGQIHPQKNYFNVQVLAKKPKNETEFEYFPLGYASCQLDMIKKSHLVVLECIMTETYLTLQALVDGRVFECHFNTHFVMDTQSKLEFYHLPTTYNVDYEQKVKYMFKQETPMIQKKAEQSDFYTKTKWIIK